LVEITSKFPFVHRVRAIEAKRGRGAYAKQEAEKGTVDVTTRWSDKQPHPTSMGRYDDLCNDPEVSIAITLLADMVAPSYYTEMPRQYKGKDVDPEHKNKQTIDEYGERVNLDEDLQTIVRVFLGKGFSPVERLSDYDLKLLPPEGFYIWKDKKGKVLKYTQEVQSATVATWEGKEMEDIILFINDEDPSHPYGKSLTEPIVKLLDARQEMNEDMPRVIHRYAYPMGIWQSDHDISPIEKEVTERDPDQDIFIGKVKQGEVRQEFISVDPQARFVPYIEMIYYQIAEALHAPLLLYLKNATEASGNVMMEAVERYIQGKQRYVKRRVERFLFEPQCGEPVPRLVWGQPTTGLEEIELDSIANLYASNTITFTQAQDLLKKLGIELIDPSPEELQRRLQPQVSFGKQFEKPPLAPMPPMEMILDKMNDLGTALNIIEANYNEKRISLVKAMKMGHKAIDVHCKRMFPQHLELFTQRREQQYEQWGKRLFKVKEKKQPTYTVTVED